jgi:hypothetical protein
MALLTMVGLGGCSDAPGSSTDRFWVELGPGSTASARLITEANRCPSIEIDGASVPMSVRAAPAPPAFPVLTCEAALPAGVRRVALDGVALPLPHPDPQRIAVIGDTGCRLETGDPPQSCNDPEAWPFADLALAVADWRPDLVVHVGDYLYREDPCPEGDEGCAAARRASTGRPSTPTSSLPRSRSCVSRRSRRRAATTSPATAPDRSGSASSIRDPLEPECSNYTEPYAIEPAGCSS